MKIVANQAQPQQRLQDSQSPEQPSVGSRHSGAVATAQRDRRDNGPSGPQARIYALTTALESPATSVARPFFSPPQRINGQIGYPLSPDRPPKLPAKESGRRHSEGGSVTTNPQAVTAHYSKQPPYIGQASTSSQPDARWDIADEPPGASTSRQRATDRPESPASSAGSGHVGHEANVPIRPPRRKELPLPPPPTSRELIFFSRFNSIEDANRQLGHLKMDRNPAWLSMGTKEPYFGENKKSGVGAFSNENNSPFMKRWQQVWGNDETRGKNFSNIWQSLVKNQKINFQKYVDDQTMDLALFNSKFQESMSDPDKSVPKITPNTYRNELTARQDFKRDVYLLQREALNEDSPIFKLDSRSLKSLEKLSFKWPFSGEGGTISKLMPYRTNDQSIKHITERKAYYEDVLYRYGNDDNSMNGVINERSRLQRAFHDEISGYFSDRQLKAQLEFWNWSKLNVAGGVAGFHLLDYVKKAYGG